MALFAKETFVDEAAHLAKADPLAFRLAMLRANPRATRALKATAEAIGWGTPAPPGVGRGLAVLEEWETVVAHAIEVEVKEARLAVRRIVVAADPGLVINPNQARAQFEGGSLMALSAALGEAVAIENGRATTANFDAYPLLRMRQAPKVDVVLL